MTLIIPVGDLGSGKTLFATMMANDSTVPVYSNYKLNLPQYRELTPQMLVDINEEAIIIIDEAYAWLESRLSNRDMNRYLSYILFQSRKRQLDFIITAQLLSTIDVRFRDMCTYLVLCQKIPEGFKFSIVKNSMYRYRPVELFMSWEQAQTLYPLYDTMEKIDPIDAELMSNIIEESSPKDFNLEIANLAREIITKNPNRKITQGFVKDYMILNEKPLTHTEDVFNRINSILISMKEKNVPEIKEILDGNEEDENEIDENEIIDNSVKELIKQYGNRRITRIMIKDYLFQNKLKNSYLDYIYQRTRNPKKEKKCIPNVKESDAQ